MLPRRFLQRLPGLRAFAVTASAAAALCLAAPASAQLAPARALDISFHDGKVTLVAANVTVNEILREWNRVGGSVIVNGEKLAGAPVTYEFHDVPEAAALQALLRGAAGYIAAPRRVGGPAGGSLIEQVLILPTSHGVASAASVMTAPVSLQPNPVAIQGSPDDDIPPVRNQTPQPQAKEPPPPSTRPTTPATSAVPGVVIPPVKPGTIIK